MLLHLSLAKRMGGGGEEGNLDMALDKSALTLEYCPWEMNVSGYTIVLIIIATMPIHMCECGFLWCI